MFNKIKEDLQREFEETSNYNIDCKNKQKILKNNTIDSRLTKIGIIGMFSILPSMIASTNIIAPISTGLALPLTVSMGVALISSIAIGYTTQAIITSVSKKKMKKFTNVKTNADILEEMMHYEMEIDKVENKRDILREMYDNIIVKQKLSSDYANDFLLYSKYKNLTFEDLKKRQEMLTKAYDERIEQLDVLTSQAYLKDKFQLHRKKRERIENIIVSALMTSLPFCILIGMPFSLELMKDINLESMAEFSKILALCFSPTLIVTPLSMPYFIKRNKDFMHVFNNLNQSLKEFALSEKTNIEYEKELNYMIDTKKREIIELGIELKEMGYIIEKRNMEDTIEIEYKTKSKEDILFQDFPKLHITEDTRRDVLEHPERYSNCDTRTRMGMFYTDEEKERYIEESLNRPLPGEEEKTPTLVKKRIPPKK